MAGLDRVEAAVRAGRAETARAWVPELDDFARGTGAAWAVAIAEHGRALLANPPEAELHSDPRPIHDRRGNFGEGPELLRRS